MYSIFNSYLLKLTGTVAGLAFSLCLKGPGDGSRRLDKNWAD